MPTGYTAGIEDGTIKTFQEYALQCTRAFGALISMRDDPSNTPIPKEIVPDTSYHEEQLVEARAEKEELEKRTDAEWLTAYREYLSSTYRRNEERQEEFRRLKDTYAKFLRMANAYVPPTSEHVEFKEFLINQIEISKPTLYRVELMKFDEWKEHQISGSEWNINYHTKEIEDEIAQAKARNQWLQDVYKSLTVTPKTELGTFTVSGLLNVTDPCYEKGTWCSHLLSVRPGDYKAFVEHSDEGDWGLRNSSLIISFAGIEYDRSEEQKTDANIGVDSGQAGFFDMSHYPEGVVGEYGEPQTFYGKACAATDNEAQAGIVDNFGVVSSSGYGDGGYDLYIVMTDGEITGARIEFIGKETDPEQVHDDGVREKIEGEDYSFV